MKIAETVTFGGSALDRAAQLRGDEAGLAALGAAQTTISWRNKPLVEDRDGGVSLVRLPMDHPVLADALEPPIFLGREGDTAVWSHDVSAWRPDDLDDADFDSFLDASEQVHPLVEVPARFAELRAIMTRLDPRNAELAATAKAVMGWHGTHGFCARCGEKTVIAMSGWQRNCPACGGHHFPRTDPVVIMLITHGNDVLLGRSPGWPEGMFSLLAGFVEPGETLEAAVRREVFEEAGVEVGSVGYLASQPWPFPASLMFGCWGEAATKEITIDPSEIEDALWVSRERLARIFAGEDAQILPARNGAIAHFLLWNWLTDRLD